MQLEEIEMRCLRDICIKEQDFSFDFRQVSSQEWEVYFGAISRDLVES